MLYKTRAHDVRTNTYNSSYRAPQNFCILSPRVFRRAFEGNVVSCGSMHKF